MEDSEFQKLRKELYELRLALAYEKMKKEPVTEELENKIKVVRSKISKYAYNKATENKGREK